MNSGSTPFITYPMFGFQPNSQDWVINILCDDCKNHKSSPTKRYKSNPVCLECILSFLHTHKRTNIGRIEFNTDLHVPPQDLHLLLELSIFFKSWREIYDRDGFCQKKGCVMNTPLNFSSFIITTYNNSLLCASCKKKLKNLYNNLRKQGLYLQLLKVPSSQNWQKYLFLGPYTDTFNKILPQLSEDNPVIAKYTISSYPLYTITIYENKTHESSMQVSTCFGKKSHDFYLTLIADIEENLPPLSFDRLLPIGTVLDNLSIHITSYLYLNYHNLNSEEIENISFYTSVQKLNIAKIFPLLVDELIDEIYLDNPQSSIYIDHRDFGRCTTSITLSDLDIGSIKTFLRISSNKRLDISNPTIKCSIHNQYFKCRFAIDTNPVVQKGFCMDIRKMNLKIFTLPELITRGMLSSDIAAFLYACVLLRMNITTVGETNTGKTTLINSLDLLTPSHYRKIYIEESSESVDHSFLSSHQVKYQVDSVYSNTSKITEIYRLLHRNPDIVYLGEILTKDEAHAMFHCLSAGLRGFQTIHARDLDSLLNRWQYHFKINPACYNDLDIVIMLKQHPKKRYISEIVEISFFENQVKSHPIFSYDIETEQWSDIPNLANLHCFRKLFLSARDLDTIQMQLTFYKDLFNHLVKQGVWDAQAQAKWFQSLYNQLETYRLKNIDIDRKILKNFAQNLILGEK